MISTVLKTKSHTAYMSSDGSMILNVTGKPSIWRVENAKLNRISSFEALKNSSSGALATDLTKVAYKNTSGKIAVHDIESGELILKHDAAKDEGCGLHFIKQNRQIVSSTWDSVVFVIGIASGELVKTRIGDGEYLGAPILQGLRDEEFYVYCLKRNARRNALVSSTVFKLTVATDGIEYEPICEMPICSISTPIKLGNSLLFSSDPSSLLSKLYLFNPEQSTYHEYIDVQHTLNTSFGEDSFDLQGITHLSASTEGKYIVVVCKRKTIMIIETSTQKCIKRVEHNFVSNVLFFNNDKNLWVGTWEKVYIYNFLELIGEWT